METEDISAGRSAVVVIGGCFSALLPFLRDADFLHLLLASSTSAIARNQSCDIHTGWAFLSDPF